MELKQVERRQSLSLLTQGSSFARKAIEKLDNADKPRYFPIHQAALLKIGMPAKTLTPELSMSGFEVPRVRRIFEFLKQLKGYRTFQNSRTEKISLEIV